MPPIPSRPRPRLATILAGVLLLAVGAGPARADKCNGAKVKAIGKTEAGLLGCSAKEATKTGIEPTCGAKVSAKFTKAYDKPTGCSPASPADTTCETAADSDCQTAIRAAFPDGTGTAPSKCEASRLKAAGKLASAELGCIAKAAAKGIPVDSECIAKATGKFTLAFNKVSGCTGDGNASAIQADVESDCVNDMVNVSGGNFVAITCGAGSTTTTTTPVSTTTTTTMPCTFDNQPCTGNAQCCSGTCTGGVCAPVAAACVTIGNACTLNDACCSLKCQDGQCADSSYCRQTNDVCSVGTDCCSGTCTAGTCAAPATAANCSVDGTVCGGVLACGGGCCSGLCAPYAPTGVGICQPASGCHVTGDSCTKDTDCCGGPGLPGGGVTPVTCAITPPATTGVCRALVGCKPDGEVCRLSTMSCNASCDCCSGNCDNEPTCKPDSEGVPRCTGSTTTCVAAGGSCASSADCCDTEPCVPNPSGTPPFVCAAATTCATGNSCTIGSTPDGCCAGTRCTPPVGHAESPTGTCTTCNASGQVCTTDTECCDGTRCALTVGSTQGTCTP